MRLAQSEGGTRNFDAGHTEFGTFTNFSYETAIVRHVGGTSIEFPSGAGGYVQFPDFDAGKTDLYARTYFRLDAAPSGGETPRLLSFLNASDQYWGAITTPSTRVLQVRVNNGLDLIVDSGTLLWSVNTWHCLELRVGPSTVESWLDGVLWATLPVAFTTTGDLRRLRVGTITAHTPNVYVTDLAVNDTTGSLDAGRCGLTAGVVTVFPRADAGASPVGGWIAQNGGAHYEEIDELPGAVDTTTYIKETAGVEAADQRFFLTLSPIEGAVTAAIWGVRGGGTAATNRFARVLLLDERLQQVNGTTVNWNLNGWKTDPATLRIEEQFNESHRMLTTDYLDRCMTIVQRNDAAVLEIRISAIWATYDVALPLATATQRATAKPRVLLEVELP